MSGQPSSAPVATQTDAAVTGSTHSTNESASAKSGGTRARKRTLEGAGVEPSPESEEDDVGGSEERRRQPGVKRACNECRQQKLRCDVVQEPQYVPCQRCQRLNLGCKIDTNFRRVGKRSKNAEMEREIVELRMQLQQASPTAQTPHIKASSSATASPNMLHTQSSMDEFLGSQEAVASLIELRSGVDTGAFLGTKGQTVPSRKVENVNLSPDRVRDLFYRFFTFYSPFLPMLHTQTTPDEFFDASPLLFWVMISVAARHYEADPRLLTSISGPLSRLLWGTLAEVPQNYFVVKALCLLCTWPLPISSTSSDPTNMLCGLMMQIAMQIGLHRPSHAQDFTKFKVELREEEFRDRVRTWASCNAVAQRVATGYGQPPATVYDWTLAPTSSKATSFKLPYEPEARLIIERFCNKVTKSLYCNNNDPIGLPSDAERSTLMGLLGQDLEDLESTIRTSGNPTPMTTLYLRAAGLHLRLSTFFASPTCHDYQYHLLALWFATTAFLESALAVETSGSVIAIYATNYILQMVVAAGFTLLKLLNSFFAENVDLDYGKALFSRCIWLIRSISVANNDMPSRLAEVLAQLWKSGGGGSKMPPQTSDTADSSLQLKVRCRMSQSLVFDSVWRWREEFQAKGRGNLESALNNPTNPDSAAESSANSAVDPSVAPPALFGANNSYGDPTYEVFDPLSWTLDGLIDFPFGYPDGQTMP